jgi:hypothetical protein
MIPERLATTTPRTTNRLPVLREPHASYHRLHQRTTGDGRVAGQNSLPEILAAVGWHRAIAATRLGTTARDRVLPLSQARLICERLRRRPTERDPSEPATGHAVIKNWKEGCGLIREDFCELFRTCDSVFAIITLPAAVRHADCDRHELLRTIKLSANSNQTLAIA